jgi:hypothetical protein
VSLLLHATLTLHKATSGEVRVRVAGLKPWVVELVPGGGRTPTRLPSADFESKKPPFAPSCITLQQGAQGTYYQRVDAIFSRERRCTKTHEFRYEVTPVVTPVSDVRLGGLSVAEVANATKVSLHLDHAVAKTIDHVWINGCSF